ncbi:MAG: hypothetical protein A2341_22370 [Deltaproteobacteria bacterium RIFOXYB12_FULL_58_9]|nr:MAG: hypothetical protein A2341_22370 [Deltaproteobacteria bacterium RIFOXYB12_FULL_58_9]
MTLATQDKSSSLARRLYEVAAMSECLAELRLLVAETSQSAMICDGSPSLAPTGKEETCPSDEEKSVYSVPTEFKTEEEMSDTELSKLQQMARARRSALRRKSKQRRIR